MDARQDWPEQSREGSPSRLDSPEKAGKRGGGGGSGGGNVGEPANKQVSWVGRVGVPRALTLGSGAGGNQPVHPVGPPHSPAAVTLIPAFLALLVNACPGRGLGSGGLQEPT